MTAAACALIIVSALMLWKSAPPEYTLDAWYNVTFNGILPHSKHMDAAMKDLDLDSSYIRYIGKRIPCGFRDVVGRIPAFACAKTVA